MAGRRRIVRFVADHLGVDVATAGRLLTIARASAPDHFGLRVAGFAVAAWEPLARALPRGLRRRALEALLRPMVGGPAGINAYAADRPEAALARDGSTEPCES